MLLLCTVIYYINDYLSLRLLVNFEIILCLNLVEKNVKAYGVSKGNAVIRSSGYLLTKEQS